MNKPLFFPFTTLNAAQQHTLPYVPIILTHRSNSLTIPGLLDTGATVNVMPYAVGTQLGFNWDEVETHVRLTGNLASAPAKAIVVAATLGQLPPIRLAFAWTQIEAVPLLLGQVNFFMEFDVCFYRSRLLIEVKPKG